MGIGMLNACTMLKASVAKTARMEDSEAKKLILSTIDNYKNDRIFGADKYVLHPFGPLLWPRWFSVLIFLLG